MTTLDQLLSADDPNSLFGRVRSHALASGRFARVNQHEPKNAPGHGLSAALWVDRIDPVAEVSGLAATSARIVFHLRVYSNMLQEPQDAIDPGVLSAVAALMTAYSGDFTLGGLVKQVDLLGQHGISLSARAGYINQDSRLYRVMLLQVPIVINDVFDQEE
ncbi:MAG: hypothetical protein ACRDT2_11080 [Natronosporangium sp.]